MHEKIKTLEEVASIIAGEKIFGKRVGLVTGCFDILHVGHLDLFHFAKNRVDILAVGVEQDETLKGSKGENRPVNKLEWRCEILSELAVVDLVFPVEFSVRFHPSKEIDDMYAEMYKKVAPDYLITNIIADKFWEVKQNKAREMGIGFLGQESVRSVPSTAIIEKGQEETRVLL